MFPRSPFWVPGTTNASVLRQSAAKDCNGARYPDLFGELRSRLIQRRLVPAGQSKQPSFRPSSYSTIQIVSHVTAHPVRHADVPEPLIFRP